MPRSVATEPTDPTGATGNIEEPQEGPAIEAEVTDQSRRTIFGTGSVLAARRPFEVYVSLNQGYYQTGEVAEATVNARTLDGREVQAMGGGRWDTSSLLRPLTRDRQRK